MTREALYRKALGAPALMPGDVFVFYDFGALDPVVVCASVNCSADFAPDVTVELISADLPSELLGFGDSGDGA